MKSGELFDVAGRVAYVTGAAGGLGLAMAEVMAVNGASVTMTDIDEAGLEAAADRLRDSGCKVETEIVDVADIDTLSKSIDAAAARHGRLDVLFANAGISAGPGFATEIGQINAVTRETWDRVLRINLTSVFVSIQAAAAHMKTQRDGRIIVTSSIAGLGAEPVVGYAYVATKAAVANLVRQAAHELAAYNVMVNAIAPGPFRTNIGGGRLNDPEAVKLFEGMVPLGRIASTDEIKGLALLLASPASSYLTGAVIPIDGGSSA